jgi:hypothetical protein
MNLATITTWIKNHWFHLIVLGAIVAVVVFVILPMVFNRGSSGSSFTAPIFTPHVVMPTPKRAKKVEILNGASYNIAGEIAILGMNISEAKLNNLLADPNTYQYVLINGTLPPHITEHTALSALRPQFTSHLAGDMAVVFNLDLGNGILQKCKALTGDYITTLAWYCVLRNSTGVVFHVGYSNSQPSGVHRLSRGFASSIAHKVGDTIVGTPFNFVPVGSSVQTSSAQSGKISIPLLP